MNTTGVQLHSNGNYWQAYWLDTAGRPQRRSLGSKDKVTKRMALQECNKIAAGHIIRPGTRDVRKAPTLKAWCDAFVNSRTGLAESSKDLYAMTNKLLAEYFGEGEPIDAIDKHAARTFRAWLAGRQVKPKKAKNDDKGATPKTVSEATVCLHIRNTKAIFNAAVEDELLIRNPFNSLRSTPPDPDRTWPHLDDEKVQRLVDATPRPEWKALIGLLAWAGLRRGEALRLKWTDIEWERNRLVVRNPKDQVDTKHRTRQVLLVKPLADLLMGIFTSLPEGGPACPASVPTNNLRKVMRGIIKKAGFTPWPKTFHAFRKSRSTTWKAKYPASIVDAWLGHSMDVARKHYFDVPEQFYGAKDELAEAKAEIERLKQQLGKLATSTNPPQP